MIKTALGLKMATIKTVDDVFDKLVQIEQDRHDEQLETVKWRQEMHAEIAALKLRLDHVEPAVSMVLDWRRMVIGGAFVLSMIGTTIVVALNYFWVSIGFKTPPT